MDSTKFPYSLFMDRFWTQRVRRYLYWIITPGVARRSQLFWRQNKGRYAGNRGFVIGNGPSLVTADLERLTQEITIASNRIYLAYGETDWRPTLLTCSDKLVWKKYASEMCSHSDRVIVTSNLNPFRGDRRKLLCSWNLGPGLRAGFSADQGIGSYSGYTVTFINLQIAVHLGLNPIYIIGCDHYYGGGQTHSGNGFDVNGTTVGTESYHFHKDYRVPGEKVFAAPIDLMDSAYAIAHRECRQLGVEVFNATRGGYLEAFPRADLDEVLSLPSSS